ncbi:MAG TPA: DNA-3-methyladenine glycosylase I [Chitinophagales bacterium]|nr:DNA-3-methyladenine glycosylase I [Chitinophagales bacterium]
MTVQPSRCGWCGTDPLMVAYHDHEWGRPSHDDRRLFEAVVLDGFQAGLSWSTIMKKRENFRRAFDHFDAEKIARYNSKKLGSLLKDAGIIRNRMKIEAAVVNAKAFLKTQEQFGSFDKYIWQFTGYKTIHNRWKHLKQIPFSTKLSDAMSKDMKQRGFRFCGTTICYAFMQAVGMVNDHLIGCFCYDEIAG